VHIHSRNHHPTSFRIKVKQRWFVRVCLRWLWRVLRHLDGLLLDHLFDKIIGQDRFLILKSELLVFTWLGSLWSTTALHSIYPDHLRFILTGLPLTWLIRWATLLRWNAFPCNFQDSDLWLLFVQLDGGLLIVIFLTDDSDQLLWTLNVWWAGFRALTLGGTLATPTWVRTTPNKLNVLEWYFFSGIFRRWLRWFFRWGGPSSRQEIS